ncbi:Solute carrier family 2, facilitated glucose transporter member 1 [Zancudomyces culisetae]|uniref:Solute carrier family 2, facilitated glucose transporter member 1 n=1 Tax=Zancudomyces culisetae TaxID=1213189 RepID=A0A1R1PGD0_ZANCU|nr:Solute carrier family 2, facilitated glucose transporter member 1 [Zancudomyces culisetae]|eukprot:OMH79973.1 Solute carrier family 2, facilitated glucose transporter member 1 [Zancudomyces culisetae]
MFFVGAALEAFLVAPAMLISGRFVSGLGSGVAIVVSPMYLTEIAPVKSRDSLNLLSQLAIVLGIMVSELMGYFFKSGSLWRNVFGFGMVVGILQAVLLHFAVESPNFYFISNKQDEAENALRKLRGCHNVNAELNSWTAKLAIGSAYLPSDKELNGSNGAKKTRGGANHYSILTIFTKSKY